MQITLTERIESLKVGVISAIAFMIPYSLFLWVHVGLLGEPLTLINGFVKGISALITGFLFGVTYRYVVQNNENPHLKDGAVAAFSLVRGVAPLQLSEDLGKDGLRLSLFLGESIVFFWVSRLVVDLAFDRGWIKS